MKKFESGRQSASRPRLQIPLSPPDIIADAVEEQRRRSG
jgi:hypothetical protein